MSTEIDESLDTYLRPSVRAFARLMEAKLRARDDRHPDGWAGDTIEDLFAKLDARHDELSTYCAFASAGSENALVQLAGKVVDVANFAMMLADKARALPERIERAAIALEDGRTFSLPRPARHHNVMQHVIEQIGIDGWRAERVEGTHEQGFVTSHGRFVRRKPAMRIARDAGQLLDRAPTGPKDTLFSEDVW